MRSLRPRPIAWIADHRSAKLALALAVVVLGAGAAIAIAGVPDQNGVIHACLRTGTDGLPATAENVRVIDPSAGQSCTSSDPAGGGTGEQTLTWNVTGPQGPQGPQGPAGSNGTATVTSASPVGTITISGLGSTSKQATSKAAGVTPLTADILSFSFVSNGSAGKAGTGSGKQAAPSQIKITKTVDASSPALQKASVEGKSLLTVTVALYKPGTTTVGTTIKLGKALIASEEWSASSGGGSNLQESLTFVAQTLKVTSSGGGSGLPAVQKFVAIPNPKA